MIKQKLGRAASITLRNLASDERVEEGRAGNPELAAFRYWFTTQGGDLTGDKFQSKIAIDERRQRYPNFPIRDAELHQWLEKYPKVWEEFIEDTTILSGFPYETSRCAVIMLRIILVIPLVFFTVSLVFGDFSDMKAVGMYGVTQLKLGNRPVTWYFQSTDPSIIVPALWLQMTESVYAQYSQVPLPPNCAMKIIAALEWFVGGCVKVLCCLSCRTKQAEGKTGDDENMSQVCKVSGITNWGWLLYTYTASMVTVMLIRTGWSLVFTIIMSFAAYICFPLLFLQFSQLIVARHLDLAEYQQSAILRGGRVMLIIIFLALYSNLNWQSQIEQATLSSSILSRDIGLLWMAYELLFASKALALGDLNSMQIIALTAVLFNIFTIVVMFGCVISHTPPSMNLVWYLNSATVVGWIISATLSMFGFYLRSWQQASELRETEKWHFFLSHCQATGGNQANVLCLELQKRGYKVWYDNTMTLINKNGMCDGVRGSAVFLLFMSEGVF